jgi:hypothetical protein
MTFENFLGTYNGKTNVGNTTANKGQCVGLVAVWIESLNLPHVWGDAFDMFVNADEKFFEKILNTPEALPIAGDIIIWSKKFNGTVGHTGLCTGTANLDTFEAFEQNDPLGSNCHLKTYNYNFVYGWLRPITADVSQQALIDQLRADRDTNHNLYIQEREAKINLETQLDQKNKTILIYEKRIEDKDKEIQILSETSQSLTQKNVLLKEQLTALKSEKQKSDMDLEICLAQRKDLGKYTTNELIKEIWNRILKKKIA